MLRKKYQNGGSGYFTSKDIQYRDLHPDLIDAIKKSISPSGAIAGPFPVSLVNPSYLDAVSSKLNSFLSEKVTTV